MVIHILQEELKQSQKKRRESGSFVGSSQSLEGSSTLHWACKAGRVTEVEALLAAGADSNKLDRAQFNPFMDAINSGKSFDRLNNMGLSNIGNSSKRF